MNPGPFVGCGEFPSGQTVYMSFSWQARANNTVDISYAYTETDVQASSGYTLLGSGLPTAGTVQIPRVCPNGAGTLPYLSVKVVANASGGSATAFYWGL